MKKYDVVALGELLIDFTVNGMSNQGNVLYEANPGGAPCNVLAMLNKLGNWFMMNSLRLPMLILTFQQHLTLRQGKNITLSL